MIGRLLKMCSVVAVVGFMAAESRADAYSAGRVQSWSDETMTEGSAVLAPLSFVRFCVTRPSECSPDGAAAEGPDGPEALAELASVNGIVNRAIRPKNKPAPHSLGRWAIGPAAGDCNDYAVTKRHELLKRGWSSADLLLAAAETSWGEGHLVLVVRVGGRELVLDNLTGAIRPWHATGYRWLKRQSSEDPRRWVSLDDLSSERTFMASADPSSWRLRRGG